MADPVELKGLADLDAKLQLVGQIAAQRVMRQALFQATKPIVERAKQNVRAWPRGSGALEHSIGRSFRVGGVDRGSSVKGGSRFAMQVGPRLRARTAVTLHNLFYRRQRPTIYYGHFLEFGHRIVARKAVGKVDRRGRARFAKVQTGSVQPKRFLGPALEASSLSATLIFQNQLRRRLNRALKKMDPGAENA